MMPVDRRAGPGAARGGRLAGLTAGFVGRPGAPWFDAALVGLTFVAVALYMSLRGAANFCLIMLAVLSFADLPAAWREAGRGINRRALLAAMVALAAPIVAVAIGQLLRGDWIARAFDAPSRLLLGIPVLLVFHYKRIDVVRIVGIAAPLALIGLVAQVHLDPRALAAWSGRYATYFVDTDTFGVYTLLLAVMATFAAATVAHTGGLRARILIAIGVIAGAYLVIGSQTRTAWLLVPIAVVLWFVLRRPRLDVRMLAGILAVILAGVASLYVFHGVADRLFSVYTETSSWVNRSNPDTSGGLRLTMWRIALVLFAHRPLQGYGDNGYRAFLDAAWITSFASPRAIETISAGPHNELLANLLRSGIAGGIAVVLEFAVPLVLFWRARRANRRARLTADTGLVFMLCLMAACVTFEMFTLKYASTFNALMIAGLLAQALAERAEPDEATAGTASRDA